MSDVDAAERLRTELATDPWTDGRIVFWATQRHRVLHAIRYAAKTLRGIDGQPRDHEVRLDEKTAKSIRYGTDPSVGPDEQPQPRAFIGRRGRPSEQATDDANMLLLEQFPQLEENPIALAALERLHGLDKHLEPTSRLPLPGECSKDEALARVNTVGHRARNALKRARAILETSAGKAKVAMAERPPAFTWTMPEAPRPTTEIDAVLRADEQAAVVEFYAFLPITPPESDPSEEP